MTKAERHVLSRHWHGSGTDWNHLRNAVSACMSTDIGTDRFPYRRMVIDRMPLLDRAEREPDITMGKLGENAKRLPEAVRFFPWFLAFSGCRIGKYLRFGPEHLKPNTCAIDVPGTKTSAAKRTIFVDPIAWCIAVAAMPSYLRYQQLRRLWRAAGAEVGVPGVTTHDLRHVCG